MSSDVFFIYIDECQYHIYTAISTINYDKGTNIASIEVSRKLQQFHGYSDALNNEI